MDSMGRDSPLAWPWMGRETLIGCGAHSMCPLRPLPGPNDLAVENEVKADYGADANPDKTCLLYTAPHATQQHMAVWL